MAANRANIGWYIDNQIGGKDDRFTGRIYEKEVKLTNAQLKALKTTAIELVAAPGTGRFIEFVSAVLYLHVGSEVLAESGANDNIIIEYDDGSGAAVCTTIESTGFIEQTVDQIMLALATILAGTTIASSVVNKNLAILSDQDDFTGNASNDATMTVKVTYRLHDFN